MQNFITILLSSRDRAIFTFSEFDTRQSHGPVINAISQSLGLDVVNISVYAKVYQNIPKGLRVIDILRELSGYKIYTNRPVTKCSQTVR